jgi:hypothetical protein
VSGAKYIAVLSSFKSAVLNLSCFTVISKRRTFVTVTLKFYYLCCKCLFIYSQIYCRDAAVHKSDVLKLNIAGRLGVSILDNVVIIHHGASKVQFFSRSILFHALLL